MQFFLKGHHKIKLLLRTRLPPEDSINLQNNMDQTLILQT